MAIDALLVAGFAGQTLEASAHLFPLLRVYFHGVFLLAAVAVPVALLLAWIGKLRSGVVLSWLAPALFVLVPAAVALWASVLLILELAAQQ